MATGVKLVMKKFDPVETKLPTKRYAYGLMMLKCFRGGTGVYFKNCDGQKTLEANRFSFSDVGALATCAMKPVAALRVELGK